MRCRAAVLALLLIALPLLCSTAKDPVPVTPKKPLAIDDLYRLDASASPVLSPDGRKAAYVRQWIADSKQQRSLWLAEGEAGKARPVEKGEPDARRPVFSPDGKWIAFLSTRRRPEGWKQTPPAPPESDPATDVWLIPSAGGVAIPLAGPDKPYGRVFNDGFYGRIAFSPDGRRLVLVAEGKEPRSKGERAAAVFKVRPDQGEGYTGYGPAQLWVARLDAAPGKCAARRIDRLTRDNVWYGDPHWSPDGRFLVVHANRTTDRESVRYSINKDFDLWAVDAGTGALRQLTTGPGPEVSPRFSPDGKRLLCLSIPRKGSHRDVFNLAVVTLGEGGARTAVLFDHHGPGADKPPHPAPVFPLPEDCWEDKEHVIYNADVGTGSAVVRVELRSAKGVTLEKPTGRRARLRKLVPPGNRVLSERLRGESRVITWDNGEGMKIEGVLTTPPCGNTISG
jgi:dipeptidyl aminopeptidase/acylaminoacyl peptidase